MSLGIHRNRNGRRWRKGDWQFWNEAGRAVEYCGGKICYATPEEAEERIAQQTERWDKKLRYYRCPHSDHWHLTSKVEKL